MQHTFVNQHDWQVRSPPVSINAVGFLNVQITGDVSSWDYNGSLITIHWETPFAPLEARSLSISYKVVRPVAGLYFDVPSPEYPNRVLHAITDNETERCRYWLPCIDFPAVRTTLSFSLTAPSNMKAFANGTLLSETLANNLVTTEYRCETPCPSYLICLAVGEFVTISDQTVNNMPIRYIAPKSMPVEHLSRSFGKTPDMVRWIEKKLDYSFPWPKYDQIGSVSSFSRYSFTLHWRCNGKYFVGDMVRSLCHGSHSLSRTRSGGRAH